MSSRNMKTIIERGASWTLEETKLLLALWGQDLVQRQATNAKRSKEVYEKISEKFTQNGFERTADQVRTRVFNMIAEYRRILRDQTPERIKKCIFFEALDRIYRARDMDDIKSALDDYEPEFPYSPASNTISSEKGEESISDGEATDGNETINTTTTIVNATANANASTQANSNSSVKTETDSINSDNNNTDSNTTAEKEPSASNQAGTPAKKIRLDSPKSGQNQTNQTSTPSTGNSSSLQDNATTSSTSSKQNKSTTSVPLVATTIGGPTIGSTSTIRQQSLLMPHATTSTASSTSTPITKLATSANNTPSYININSTKLPIIRTNQLIGHPNGNESLNLNGTTTRLPTTAAITSHQLYQAPVNTFDVTSSALLIDRMFAHLARESENMREWIALEKERLAIEKARKQQETEREFRRERVLMDTLMRFQDQWLSFLSRIDPRIVEGSGESPPELKFPSRDQPSTETTSQLAQTTATYSMLSNNNNNSTSRQTEADKQ